MFLRGSAASRRRRPGAVPVYLNVYDLTSMNGYAYWLGLGIYHSGVQVHGVEYAYGAHERATTGIFEVEPRQCPGFRFRKSILIGRTELGGAEVRVLLEKMAEEYTGVAYHLITNNCNHFCNDACQRLVGKTIPRWVNRLASIGLICNCVLPAGLHVKQVRTKGESASASSASAASLPRRRKKSVGRPPVANSGGKRDLLQDQRHARTASRQSSFGGGSSRLPAVLSPSPSLGSCSTTTTTLRQHQRRRTLYSSSSFSSPTRSPAMTPSYAVLYKA